MAANGQDQAFLAWMVVVVNQLTMLPQSMPRNGAEPYFAPAASVFVLLYLLAIVSFLQRSFQIRDQVYVALAFFCSIRIASFTIRTVLASLSYIREDALFSLLTAHDVLKDTAFSALLYPAYISVLKLEKFFELCTGEPPSPILLPFRIRAFFRLGLLIGVTLRLMATGHLNSNSRYNWSPSTIYALGRASNVAFLILTAIQVLLALNYVRMNLIPTQLHDRTFSPSSTASLLSSSAVSQSIMSVSRTRYPAFVILLISFLLLLRQTSATVFYSRQRLSQKPSPVVREHLWYLLIAIPEILTVLLFSYPGLVPHWQVPRIHDVERSDSDSDAHCDSENRDV